MYLKRDRCILCLPLVLAIATLITSTSVAQTEPKGVGLGGQTGDGGMDGDDGGMGMGGMPGMSIQAQLPSLSGQGILAIRNSITVGGVTISEARGLAIVLSREPLVLVTGKELLQVGKEYPEKIPGAVSSIICSYFIPVIGMEGGMGMGGGGFGMGATGSAQTDLVLEPKRLINRGDDSDLLFVFATADATQGNLFSTARLAKNPNPTGDWKRWAWLEDAFPEILQENANASTIATIAPDGSVALIIDGRICGRDAIMKEYLQVYNSRVREDEAFRSEDDKGLQVEAARQQVDFAKQQLDLQIASGKFMDESLQNELKAAQIKLQQAERELSARSQIAGPSSPNILAIPADQAAAVAPMGSTPLLEQSSGQSIPSPLANTIQAQRLDAPNLRSDRIINAVVEVKTADDEAQAAKARSQLRELLEIEFDAQRTQKAIELESLRQRIQQLEKAEEELKGQRDQTIEQRLNRLLGKPAR